MNFIIILATVIFAACLMMTSSVSASPTGALQREVKLSLPAAERTNGPLMEIANRLLISVMNVAYEILQDLGASDEELERVRQKKNYIQTCYFQAISCY